VGLWDAFGAGFGRSASVGGPQSVPKLPGTSAPAVWDRILGPPALVLRPILAQSRPKGIPDRKHYCARSGFCWVPGLVKPTGPPEPSTITPKPTQKYPLGCYWVVLDEFWGSVGVFGGLWGVLGPRAFQYPGLAATGQAFDVKFIGCGATHVTKSFKFLGFGTMDVTKPYRFIYGLGPWTSPNPINLQRLGSRCDWSDMGPYRYF
jgi:hypothetical protein